MSGFAVKPAELLKLPVVQAPAARKPQIAAAQSAPQAKVGPAAVLQLGGRRDDDRLSPPYTRPAVVPPTAASSRPGGAAFVAGEGPVVVDVLNSDSGYDNRIYYSTDNWATRHYVGTDNQTASVNIGTFAAGTKIEFGIDNGQGDFFRTGGASANSDGFDHTKLENTSSGVKIGFEDLRGGGDRDFNDAIIHVRNQPKVEAPGKAVTAEPQPAPAKPAAAVFDPKPAPAKPAVAKRPSIAPAIKPEAAKPEIKSMSIEHALIPLAAKPAAPAAPKKPEVAAPTPLPNAISPAEKPAVPKPVVTVHEPKAAAPSAEKASSSTNRSGLGDGTNPGNGAGRANSPNTGTLNPNRARDASNPVLKARS